MKKLLIALVISVPLLFLASCSTDTVAVDTVVYDPGYSNNYVYSVGYYNNRPYWGNYYYYPGYVWGNGYWGAGYYNGY